MKFPTITLVFGHLSHQGDLMSEFTVPIYHAFLKDDGPYMGLSPSIRQMLDEHKKFTNAMMTLHGMGILFFRLHDGEWIVE